MCVCLHLLCLVCSMIPLVFLQVLEPFCLLSEQENLEPEEVEVIQPTSSITKFITSKTKRKSTSLSSDSTYKDQSHAPSFMGVDIVPVTVAGSPSILDTESVPPFPLSECCPGSQPCSVSVPPVSYSPSDPHSRALSVADDSFIPPQSQSDPPNSQPCVHLIVSSFSEILSNESNDILFSHQDGDIGAKRCI